MSHPPNKLPFGGPRRCAGVVGLLGAISCGCRTALPSDIFYDTSTISNVQLRQRATECKQHLNDLRTETKRSGDFSDAMTILGGVVAASGSVGAASFQGLSPDARTPATIVAASVAAAGGILALASKLVDGPTASLAKHSGASRQWITGLKVVEQNNVVEPPTPYFQYSVSRFVDCTNDAADAPPPLPDGVERIAVPPPVQVPSVPTVTTNHCRVDDCGITSRTSCEKTCMSPQQAKCTCDVCGRSLGVVTCLRENCRCE